MTEVPAATGSACAGILAMMKFVQLLLLICLAGGVLGCGQKGPLVMPDAQQHKRTVPTAPGAPAKPASGETSPAPAGAGAATSPAPPAPAPTAPSTPPTADTTHP
ncbi:MAG: lipoprotein [Steroidobacteraceae bacterium]